MNNDLISRSALKEDFECVGFNDYDDYNRALRIIDNAPTIECTWIISGKRYGKKEEALKYLRPHGEWIIDGHHIRCNKCNEYICRQDLEGAVIPNNFCPNCGADMKGDEE